MNQYTQAGDKTYEFDADGNLVRESSPAENIAYTYNDDNRLVAVHSATEDRVYQYDAFGDRVFQTIDSMSIRYVYDPIGQANIIGEYHVSGSPVASYRHGLGLVSRIDSTGNSAYFNSDALGNAHQLITSAGTVSDSYAYMPFGMLLSFVETLPNSFQFIGGMNVVDPGFGWSLAYARL